MASMMGGSMTATSTSLRDDLFTRVSWELRRARAQTE